MKKFYSLILCMVMAFTLLGAMTTNVKADEATLSELKVEAQNSAGERTDVKLTPEFSADTTEYEATVANDTIKLVLTPTTTEEDADYKTEWEALDVGDNKTYITVTAADGTKTKYTISTKRLTEEEEATYKADENTDDDNDSESGSKKVTVKVGKTNMLISSDFKESDIPEGFSETKAKYDGKKYAAIKGDKKDIVAFWLKSTSTSEDETSEEETAEEGTTDSKSGFYIYDEESGSFYAMKNIYVKSRMYTIVNKAEPDSFLNDYETAQVEMIDEEVEAWVLDETNSLYLVYAMNWDGQTNLYCYDDVEKCFQRYIIDSAAATQLEAANDAINNLQDKNNELIKKYNQSNGTKWKIIAALLILVVILFFVTLNLSLSLKARKINGGERVKKERRKRPKKEEEDFDDEEEYDEYGNDDDDDELFKLVEDDDDDFVILNERDKTGKDDFSGQKENDEFELGMDEIDISAEIMKEMEADKAPVQGDVPPVKVEKKQPFLADKGEPFNEKDLKDVLSTAFPNENKYDDDDDDDDGFTFI